MRLGEIIGRLKESPSTNLVRISGMGEMCPQCVTSYRGYYEDLGVVPSELTSDGKDQETCTVRDFIVMLEDALGREFTGYKGGEFLMTKNTRVWIADYGSASGLSVYAIADVANTVERFTSIITFEDHYSRDD